MLINIVNNNAAQTLLECVEESSKSNTSWGALHFACSKSPVPINEENLLLTIRPLVGDRNATLYLFDDGDIVITFQGSQSTLIKALSEALFTLFKLPSSKSLYKYFDSQAQGEELRSMLLKKENTTRKATKVQPEPVFVPQFTKEQINGIKTLSKERKTLSQPTILIVEDQIFSRTLLENLLRRNYICHSAANAREALALYAEHCPCIVFLDIELPDASGHELASILTQYDPESFIVMVTANNYIEDVKRAKANGARGFVAKPYSKQKILDNVEKYIYERKLKN